MAKYRYDNIGYTLKNILRNMYRPGESKRSYIAETNLLRATKKRELIAQGYSKKEAHRIAQKICTYRDIIFCEGTLKDYQKAVSSFEQFCKETLGTKRISTEEASLHIQDFVNWGIEKGHSPYTINLRLSAVCKALGLSISDYKKPIRHAADTVRSSKPAKNDTYNAARAEKALNINRLIGVRRHELAKIKLTDIHFISKDRAEVHTIGKGGKHNVNLLFTEEDVAALKAYVDEAAANGQIYLLTKKELKNDADLHSMRAARAKDVYAFVCADMTAHPERREYYIAEIKTAFKRDNKRLHEDLSKPYKCRGKNREKLLTDGRSPVFDRIAAMFVSCTVTNHFRSNVTIIHYLSK